VGCAAAKLFAFFPEVCAIAGKEELPLTADR
jgi:hypothetical protein